MRLDFKLGKNTEEYRALSEIARETGIETGENGIPVEFKATDGALRVFSDGGSVTVEYPTRTSLMRSVGIISRFAPKGAFDVSQSPSFEKLGIMVDCSRNAVMTVSAIKKMCRILAVMGYNMIMLYTEDTYEIDEYPYFGHMRGRYSKEQLREIDDYADLLGIELVPCIQTLAHLNAIFRWPSFAKYRDCNDILLAESDHVYDLIDSMLSNLKGCIRSRNINIGMDEAHMLGLGKYLKQNGYKNASDIMLTHLAKVTELCDKHGYKPTMWSDMFFRMASKTGAYYDLDAVISEDIIAKVPPQVTLAYWDYYGTNDNKYDEMLKMHEKFKNPISFAGGTSSWYGLIPLNLYSVNSARSALRSVNKHNVSEVFVTLWGDDGAVCSPFATLPTLMLYAEDCWSKDTSDSALSEALLACANADYGSFLDMEQPTNLPGRTDYGQSSINSFRYMLYQDVIAGLYDRHVPAGSGEHFAVCRDILKERRDKNPKWAYIFDSIIALCDVLTVKAELGIKIKEAYDKRDMDELTRIKDDVIPSLIVKIENLHACICKQWTTDNKLFGLDIQDLRFGGLMTRLKSVCRILDDYISGTTESIEELDQPRLYFTKPKDESNVAISQNRWAFMITPNVITHNV